MKPAATHAFALAAVAAVVCTAPRASAQHSSGTGAVVVNPADSAPPIRDTPVPLEWRWKKFDMVDYGITGAAMAVALGTAVAPVPGWRWSGSLGVEDGARTLLKVDSFEGRRTAGDVSDILLATTITAPILFDALVTSWGRRGSGEVAKQLTLIDIQTYAIVGAVTSIASSVSARERPYGANGDCGSVLDPKHIDCQLEQRTRYRSFFSGHTSLAFAGASLVCTHHARLGLYGGSGDVAACVAAMTAAGATGALRIAADRHYLGDVFVGAVTGTALGLAMPWLLHYRLPTQVKLGGASMLVVPSANGAALTGTF